jgi:hypothetical protein
MSRTPVLPVRSVAIALGLMFSPLAGMALAQAWTPPQGEGSVSVLFQDVYVK